MHTNTHMHTLTHPRTSTRTRTDTRTSIRTSAILAHGVHVSFTFAFVPEGRLVGLFSDGDWSVENTEQTHMAQLRSLYAATWIAHGY